jgi:hypothetical protein
MSLPQDSSGDVQGDQANEPIPLFLISPSDTSVTAMVREYLVSLSEEESDYERRKRLQAEVLASIESFRAGDRVSREEAHRRDALR